MTDWTTITDGVLEPGDPIRSVDALAFRDNPIAITERSTGAPKVKGTIASVQVFDVDGTWTRPAEVRMVMIEVVGGGGGGGSTDVSGDDGGGGGGAGGFARILLDVEAIASSTIVAGTGGAAGSNSNGTVGETSSWADGTNTITGTGGAGGIKGTTIGGLGGVGGVGTAGDFNGAGGAGEPGDDGSLTGGTRGGSGGDVTPYGAGGVVTELTGSAGTGSGGGGSGGGKASDTDGGAGANGVVIVTEYF